MRTKVNFETVNGGNYTVIPNRLMNESHLRIKAAMKRFQRKLINRRKA